MSSTKKRETNIELLRIICMIMIVFLHLLSFTGLLSTYRGISLKSTFVWGLEALCFVAVNCYVLISSYFSIDKKFSIRKILKLWIQIFFYSILIFIVMAFIFRVDFNKVDLLKSLFPILFKNYWFPTIYMGLCIFSPFLNIFIKNISKNQYKVLLILISFIFCVWPFLVQSSTNLEFGGAYSITWFIILYLIAGYLKLHFDINKYKNYKYLLTYFVCCASTFLIFSAINHFNIPYFSSDYFYSYNFILIVLASISLFIFFKNLKIKSDLINKIILFFAPLTFGVYLIHENPLVRGVLWSKVGVSIVGKFFILRVILIGLLIYIICSMIDYIRSLIFKRVNAEIMDNQILKKIDNKPSDEILKNLKTELTKSVKNFKHKKLVMFLVLSCIYYIFIDFFNRYLIIRSFNLMLYISKEAIIFDFVWILVFLIILYVTKGIVRKIISILLNILLLIFSVVNYFINSYFGSVFSWKDLLLSGDGLSFINSIFKYINFKLIFFVILCIVFNILIFHFIKDYTYKFKSLQTIFITIILVILGIMYKFNIDSLSGTVDGWNASVALSTKSNYYSNWIDPNSLITIGGTYDYIFRDFYESFLKKENIKESYKVVENYIEKYPQKLGDNYKGIFEGKNLIFVMMESLDDWLVNEEVTPTMWHMMNHGFNFNNHYSPVYVTGSTANTEFIANTGIYPNINKLSPNYAYKNNTYSYSVANLFKNKGYSVNSFHRSFGHIYNRVEMHSSFGYEKYFNYADMGISDEKLDLDSYIARSAYDKIVSSDKFMSFIITYSPHTPYAYSKIECSENIDEIKKIYSDLDEEKYCAYSSARETDNMFKILIEKLKEEGKLEDTVIIAFTDHPNNVLISEDEDEKLNKTIFFIYNEDMESNQINEFSSTINILPTINNLFNLESNYIYPGCDLLNCEDNYIIFKDYTYYDGENYFTLSGKPLDDVEYSKSLLISDYYKNR